MSTMWQDLKLPFATTAFLITFSFVFGKDTIYTNHYAVHVEGGHREADLLAEKYGYINSGQIGSLDDHYLFQHPKISKRSAIPSDGHHSLLTEPKVHWIEQQKELTRVKRDNDNRFTDPRWGRQWYLNRDDDLNMNVIEAWDLGYTGKNIVVSILDDGLETDHPDLVDNYDREASTDINDNDSDPKPRFTYSNENKHGTRCAGEVAMKANNDVCGVGVAYDSKIGGIRMLDGVVTDAVEAASLSFNKQHIDIYSASWGPDDDGRTVDGPGNLAKKAFKDGVTEGRGGKGNIFVWASGNGGHNSDNCNCDGYQDSIYTMSISSVDEFGNIPWYLEQCSSTLATTYSSGEQGGSQISSTDLQHECTDSHTGTSASAPLAAGLIALVLEANSALTWRDVQHIVVMTSRRGNLIDKDPGWVTNGAGYEVSHWYGFGLMDAGAMVRLAEKWKEVPTQNECETPVDTIAKKISGSGKIIVTMTTDFCDTQTEKVNYLEHVQVKMFLDFSRDGDLSIDLISPAGTRSNLLSPRKYDHSENAFENWIAMTTHFWGEKAQGTWTLEIQNKGSSFNTDGDLSIDLISPAGTRSNLLSPRKYDHSENAFENWIAMTTHFWGEKAQGTWTLEIQNKGSSFNTGRLLKWNLLLYGTANEVNPELRPGTSRTHSKHSMPTKNPQPRDENGSDVDDYSSYDNEYSFNDNCHPECLDNECDGPDATDCWNCAHYKDRNTLECVKRCPRGYYAPDLHHRCRYCDSTCNTCNGPSSADCLTCADGMFLVEDRGVCKSECGEGYFEDSERKMCVACHPRCTRCLYSADYCLSCKTGMKLQGSECIVSCPAQMYQTEENTCRSCHESCDSCTGSFETDCLSCAIGYLHQDGLCINSNVCEDGYYKAWEAECLSCHSTCETCNGPSEEDCLSCKQRKTSFHLQDGRCIANCPRGEFLDGDDCTPCHMTCATCHGTREDQCYECEYGLFLKNNSTCVGECGEKNYGLNGECRSCHSSCLRCRGGQPTDCTQCKDSKYLLEGICVDHCSTGYYGDEETGNCLPCDESCFTCIGPRYNECIECPDSEASIEGKCQHLPDCHGDCKSCDQDDPNLCNSCYNSFFLYENRCVSITECPSNTYANEDTNECHACHQQCHSCFDKHHTSCLSCSGDYFLTLDSTCESVCPPQTYFDYDNNICGECHPSCAECIGSDVDDCTSCDDKRWLSGYMCVYECEDNQYLDESSLCMPCHRSCETCDGPSDFDCKTCHQNYDIRDGNCLSRCSFGEYESHDTCELCHPTCGSCTGGSSTDCLSCEFGKFLKEDGSCERLCGAGYYEDYSSGTCQKCHVTCKTCLGNTDTDCLECNDGDILYEGVSCVKHCPIGFYAQNMMVPESISECQPCALECEDCTQHRDNCVSCQHSTFLYNGTCVDACPMYYTEDGNECVRTEAGCPSFCKQCNQIGDCEECDNGFRIHNGLCYLNDETCLNGQYDVWIDNKLNCHDCHDGCATCVGPSQYDCTSCNGKKILEGGKCVAHCLNSEYHDTRSGRCEACHSSCWECEGPAASQCTECNFHFFFDEDTKTCRSNCPTGMFEIGVQCMPCHESCSTCDGDTEIDCLSCELPLYHKDYSCLTECPDGYYGDRVEDVDGKDVQECRRCHYNCKTCQGPMDDDCTSCQEHLVWNRHSCRTDCGPGFFVSDGKCERCDMSCEKCSGSTKSECLSCADGKVLERGECKDKCESNYYYENNECIQCHPSCEKCTGPGPQDCSKCSLNAQLVENVCYPRCQAGYYYNDGGGTKHNVPDDDHIGGLNAAYNVLSNQTIPQCRKCHETCKECIGGGAKNCLECNIPKQLNKVTHQCVECCDPNSVTVPDNNCCVCDNGTCILSPARRQYTPIVETKNVAGMIGGVIVCIVTVFFIVFGVLQCRSKRALCFARNYHRLPTHYESKTDEVSISRKEYLDEDVEIYTKNDL